MFDRKDSLTSKLQKLSDELVKVNADLRSLPKANPSDSDLDNFQLKIARYNLTAKKYQLMADQAETVVRFRRLIQEEEQPKKIENRFFSLQLK